MLYEFVERVRGWGSETLDLRVGNAPGPADARPSWRLRALAWAVQPGIIHAHSSKTGVLALSLPWLGVRARYFYTPHAYHQMHGPAGAKACRSSRREQPPRGHRCQAGWDRHLGEDPALLCKESSNEANLLNER